MTTPSPASAIDWDLYAEWPDDDTGAHYAPALPGMRSVNAGGHWLEVEQQAIHHSTTFSKLISTNKVMSAMLHPRELQRQYAEHQAASEKISELDWLIIAGTTSLFLLAAGIFAVVQHVGSAQAASSIGGSWGIVHDILTAAWALGLGLGLGFVIRIRYHYGTVYGDTIVIEKNDPADPSRVTCVGVTKLKRLGFAGRSHQGYFFGSSQDASFHNGSIMLESRRPITEMTIQDLYALPPSIGAFTGNGASDTFSMVCDVTATAELQRQISRKHHEWIKDTAIIVLGVVAAVLVFLQAQSGYQVDPRNFDVQDPGAVVGLELGNRRSE